MSMDIQQPAVEAVTSPQVIVPVETKRWSARSARRLAWAIWALSVVLVAIGTILTYTSDTSAFMNNLLVNALGIPTILVYATVGAHVASRRPKNPIGWIYCASALLVAVQTFAEA